MKIIDRKIEQFANYLQRKNNLDHIQFLKVRLGMQVVAINIEKTIVVYGLALIFRIFVYTLLTHITYFLIRRNAHGAHANSSLMCHIVNIIIFILIPWLLTLFHINVYALIVTGVLSLIIIIKYAPSETKKQPIPKHLIKRKQLGSVVTCILILIACIFIKEPFVYFVIWGMFVESLTLLPIFSTNKEDVLK
ncbi:MULTISPECIES: accessory gene regulator AgrB [Staphylococcus]|uniref:Accessory gene regulator protein B n=2 Tax=Staphylococcus caprae TaxID=29380 RepID=A0A2H4YBZ6_9STAP|nr:MULTISPECIES: accessory gene regulator AgrB [Staphylococcus]AUD57873.1 AgrB [Staphylococcus caprae]OHO66815.1 histidine kinase [Staphylococcus sp. HMSC036D05]POA01992.1 histidine kinase [Staphylococcus caprae]SUL95122.1 accessory gene regulator B [Staphylococcus caprae]HCG75758.1 histidine kinase [Staphylococcus sp.]